MSARYRRARSRESSGGLAQQLPHVSRISQRLRAQWFECGAKLLCEELRLFPRGEMPTLVQLVEVNELRVCLFRPTARRHVELVRKHADGHLDRDALRREVA